MRRLRHLCGHESHERYTVSTVEGQEVNLHKFTERESKPRSPTWQRHFMPKPTVPCRCCETNIPAWTYVMRAAGDVKFTEKGPRSSSGSMRKLFLCLGVGNMPPTPYIDNLIVEEPPSLSGPGLYSTYCRSFKVNPRPQHWGTSGWKTPFSDPFALGLPQSSYQEGWKVHWWDVGLRLHTLAHAHTREHWTVHVCIGPVTVMLCWLCIHVKSKVVACTLSVGVPNTDLSCYNDAVGPRALTSAFPLRTQTAWHWQDPVRTSSNITLVEWHTVSDTRPSCNCRYYGQSSVTSSNMAYSFLKTLKRTESGHIELPLQAKMGRGVDTLIDYVKDADKTQLYSLFQSAATKGESISKDQFQTQTEVDELLALGVNFCCKDMDNHRKMIGFLNVYTLLQCVAAMCLSWMLVSFVSLEGEGEVTRRTLTQSDGGGWRERVVKAEPNFRR